MVLYRSKHTLLGVTLVSSPRQLTATVIVFKQVRFEMSCSPIWMIPSSRDLMKMKWPCYAYAVDLFSILSS